MILLLNLSLTSLAVMESPLTIISEFHCLTVQFLSSLTMCLKFDFVNYLMSELVVARLANHQECEV